MTTIGSIGIGLFILIIVWILALIIFVFAVRAQSNFGWVALGVAALVTVVLISIPTQKANRQEEFQTEVSYDTKKITYLLFHGKIVYGQKLIW